MKFPYGTVTRIDEWKTSVANGDERVTLTVRFGKNQVEEFSRLHQDIRDGDVVRWKRVRKWVLVEGSFQHHRDGSATAIICMHRYWE
jgi:hypothetical protein